MSERSSLRRGRVCIGFAWSASGTIRARRGSSGFAREPRQCGAPLLPPRTELGIAIGPPTDKAFVMESRSGAVTARLRNPPAPELQRRLGGPAGAGAHAAEPPSGRVQVPGREGGKQRLITD